MTNAATSSDRSARNRAHALLAGQVLFSFALCAAYGLYRSFVEGLPPQGWPNGLIILIGGILSTLCLIAYLKTDANDGQRSYSKALAGFSLMVPYAYCLYIIGYVGVWSLVQLFTHGFSVSGLLIGVAGILVGYRALNALYMISEMMKMPAA